MVSLFHWLRIVVSNQCVVLRLLTCLIPDHNVFCILGKRETVDWLLISLKDSLEDVENSREDVALVPLSEITATAMDNPLFLNLLDKFSLKKPSQQVSVLVFY